LVLQQYLRNDSQLCVVGKEMNFKFFVSVLSCLLLINCSSANLVVDPKSIKDTDKYVEDMKDCENIANQYDLTADATRGAIVGAGVGIGGIAAILATGGMYLLPAGIALAGGGGAGIGAGMSKSKERQARETIQAACLTDRGYKAYSSKG
jgi:hypothetical protein